MVVITAAQPIKTSPVSVPSYNYDVTQPNSITHALWEENDPRLVYVNYAYSIWGLDFVALLEAENWLWNIDRRSLSSYYRKGKTVKWYWRPAWNYWDFWFCQISNYYHPNITEHPKMYTDWKWQIDQCLNLYKGGTKFYWLNNIWMTRKRFVVK